MKYSSRCTLSLGSVLLHSMGENYRLFRVELTLTHDNDQEFRQLTDRIREETFPDSTRVGIDWVKYY